MNVGCRKRKVCACSLSLEISTLSSKNQHRSNIPRANTTHSRVALLGLLSIPRENDQLGLVGLQPLDIQFLPLLAQVPPPVVNDNTYTKCFFAVDTNFFQLSKGETAALPDLTVVANGLGTNGGTEESEWADTKGSGLGLASIASAEFATGLVEPGAYPALPVFAEMVRVKYCGHIMSDRTCRTKVSDEIQTVVVRETHGLV